MIEFLACMHYSQLYEQGEEAPEICLEPPKNWIALSLTFCACLPISQSAEAAFVLKYGGSGEVVVRLQNELKEANYFPRSTRSTRYYGKTTRTAISNLQQQNGLLVNGIAGKQTYAALTANETWRASSYSEVLKLGSRGKSVGLLQTQLDNWGFTVEPGRRSKSTDVFDESTRTVLLHFEEFFGLKQDGILDSENSKMLWTPKGATLVRLLKGNNFDEVENRLRAMGSSAVPYLIPLLKSQDESEVYEAAYALGRIGADAVPYLIPLLKSQDENEVYGAAYALGYIGADAKDAVPYLIPLLTNSSSPSHAMQALARIGPGAKAAIPVLVKQLEDPNSDVQGTAFTLAAIGSPATPEILQALASRDNKIRYQFAFALGFMESVDPKVVDKLLEIVKNRNEDIGVRQQAADSLDRLNQDVEWFYSENNLKSLEQVRASCPDTEPDLRKPGRLYFNPIIRNCEEESGGDGGGVIVTASSGVNIRSGPGTGYEVVGGLGYGARVSTYGSSGGWYRVNRGWISSSYTSAGGPGSSWWLHWRQPDSGADSGAGGLRWFYWWQWFTEKKKK